MFEFRLGYSARSVIVKGCQFIKSLSLLHIHLQINTAKIRTVGHIVSHFIIQFYTSQWIHCVHHQVLFRDERTALIQAS